VSAEREWWRRVLAAPVRPRASFAALRDERREDAEALQEPVLAVVLLAGMAAVLATPAWHTLMDNRERDALVVAVLTFVGGGLYGAAGYWLVGGALHLGVRGLGGTGSYRRSRHLLALALVLVAASLVLLPVEVAAYGGDAFRSTGDYDGGPEAVFLVLRLGFVAWTLGLLAVGIREVERWAWGRVAGAAALLALFLAALLAIPSAF